MKTKMITLSVVFSVVVAASSSAAGGALQQAMQAGGDADLPAPVATPTALPVGDANAKALDCAEIASKSVLAIERITQTRYTSHTTGHPVEEACRYSVIERYRFIYERDMKLRCFTVGTSNAQGKTGAYFVVIEERPDACLIQELAGTYLD